MDHRLEEASHAGDVDALHRLLQQDRLLLDRLTTTSIDNPLHIAALLGHSDFAREVIQRKHDLARELNHHGLSPMHLASASGHLSVVKELLKEGGSELCLVRDKDGLLPIHSAAFKGRVQVLAELMEARPESARELTYSGGDTVLHLAVKSNCFEAVKLLVERIDVGDEAWLNSKDDKGNTILHLAVARRQHPTIKLLLAQPGIDVNAVNVKGLTALEALLELPGENGDLILGEMIRAAAGEGGGQTIPATAPGPATPSTNDSVTRQQSNYTWISRLRQAAEWLGFHDPSRSPMDYGRQQLAKPLLRDKKTKRDDKLKQTLMLVATLIATITFQSGLSPPGGFDSTTGKALLGNQLKYFLIWDMIGLFASISVILLFVCVDSSSHLLTKTLLWVMWIAVYSTALAFTTAVFHIFPDSTLALALLVGWYLILMITILLIYLRLAVYLLRMVGWWKTTPKDGETTTPPPTGPLLVIKRILVVVMVAGVPVAVNYVYSLSKIPTLAICLSYIWSVPMLWVCHRFSIYLLHKVGWCMEHRDGHSNAQQMTAALVMKRTLAITMIVATIGAVGGLYYFLFVI